MKIYANKKLERLAELINEMSENNKALARENDRLRAEVKALRAVINPNFNIDFPNTSGKEDIETQPGNDNDVWFM